MSSARWAANQSAITQFSGTSDDGLVTATVSANLEVLGVHVADECQPASAEAGIVQAVNRALEKAEGQPVDELIRARDARMVEFNALLDGLESDVVRTRARMGNRGR